MKENKEVKEMKTRCDVPLHEKSIHKGVKINMYQECPSFKQINGYLRTAQAQKAYDQVGIQK